MLVRFGIRGIHTLWPRLPTKRSEARAALCYARPFSSHADKRSGVEEKTGDATHEEVNETGILMTRWLKALVTGWLGYKFFTIMQGSGNVPLRIGIIFPTRLLSASAPWLLPSNHKSAAVFSESRWCTDTYLIAPTLNLVRSRHPSTREDGIGRLVSWHGGDSVLPVVIEQGGAEAVLAALPTATAASRITILELLLRMVPLADARQRMLSNNAAVRAKAACASLGPDDAAAAERCSGLADALEKALLLTPNADAKAKD